MTSGKFHYTSLLTQDLTHLPLVSRSSSQLTLQMASALRIWRRYTQTLTPQFVKIQSSSPQKRPRTGRRRARSMLHRDLPMLNARRKSMPESSSSVRVLATTTSKGVPWFHGSSMMFHVHSSIPMLFALSYDTVNEIYCVMECLFVQSISKNMLDPINQALLCI